MRFYSLRMFAVVWMSLFAVNGCTDPQSLISLSTDASLPRIQQVTVLVEKSSVGFEWPPIKDPRVKGINVYRAIPAQSQKQRFIKIDTIGDRFATHYVDRTIEPNTRYMYMFTTYNLLHESLSGKVLRVQTAPAYKPVEFVKVYLRSSGVVKVLWKPHPNPRISGYVIQRRLEEGARPWRYLAGVPGRLMPEYIDSSAAKGHRYSYRVVARSSNGVLSAPSKAATITVQ